MTTDPETLGLIECHSCDATLAWCAPRSTRCCNACSHLLVDALEWLRENGHPAPPSVPDYDQGYEDGYKAGCRNVARPPGPEGEAVERVRRFAAIRADAGPEVAEVRDDSTPDGRRVLHASDLLAVVAAVDRVAAERDRARRTAITASGIETPAPNDDEREPRYDDDFYDDGARLSAQLLAQDAFADRPSLDSLLAGATREDGTDG